MDHSRSAVVVGARNLGTAVIERLRAEGWSVAGVAQSEATLDAVTASGALALRADVTDQQNVRQALEQVGGAHGGVDLIVNAASAYGGDRSGPFGGGPIAAAPPEAFDSWAVAPARSAFSFLSAAGSSACAGSTCDAHPGDGWLLPACCRGTRPVGAGSGRSRRLQVTPLAERWVP